MSCVFAHSLTDRPREQWERLHDHLHAVATRAGAFAEPFGFSAIAHTAGLLHDVGKIAAAFQAYIRGEAASGGDHSTAGARIALELYGPHAGTLIAAIVAAHHAGLADGEDLERRLNKPALVSRAQSDEATGPLPGSPAALNPARPFDRTSGPEGFTRSFLVRMLFSCLVDADFIETERFYAAANGETVERGGYASLATLNERLVCHMAAKRRGAAATELNSLRARILDHAVAKAELPPGLFTLTVPTGGGKTLASLSFALEHALRHGLKRVIYVIPYTSIIEQTAEVFRDALETRDDIVEHHSSFDWERARKGRADDECPDALSKLRRATENWDAPIVVTTAVQFFESLFANKTSRCRKLHNIAESVVVLDEAQTTPLKFLRPCLAALEELARNYRTSAVICTATQPALRAKDGALVDAKTKKPFGPPIDDDRELAPDPAALYERLRRASVERFAEPTSDASVAERFAAQPRMLAIVNTRAHAQQLYALIRGLPGAAHLSTLMCPRHRRMKLANFRTRLEAGEPVRLVSTSLIEAGVDISFDEVWRAATGLESVAQAAGRCNRENELSKAAGAPRLGRVVVFEPEKIRPQHEVRQRWQAARSTLGRFPDALGLDAMHDYFSELYFRKGSAATDAAEVSGGEPGVLPAIAESSGYLFPFRSIADAFRFIDEEAMEPVVVPWKAHEDDTDADDLLRRIAATPKPLVRDMRALQQYVVPIPKRDRDAWLAAGVLKPAQPALGEAMLRFDDLAHYREETGVDLQEPTYRSPSDNMM